MTKGAQRNPERQRSDRRIEVCRGAAWRPRVVSSVEWFDERDYVRLHADEGEFLDPALDARARRG